MTEEYNPVKLENAFKKFSCERETDLEAFLIHKAIPYENTNFGRTYLIVDLESLINGSFAVIAYFTVAQKSIDIDNLSKKKKRKMLGEYPGRDSLKSVPAYLIGQLGRCDMYTGTDFPGQKLLEECYHTISIASKMVGGNILVLECREHMYSKFYEGQEFKKLYDEVSDEGLYTLYKKISFSEYWKQNPLK